MLWKNLVHMLFFALSVCLSVCLSLSLCLPMSLSLSVCLCLTVCLCLCLSVCLSVSLSLSLSLSLCLALSLFPAFYLKLSFYLSRPLCQSVSVYARVCRSVSLWNTEGTTGRSLHSGVHDWHATHAQERKLYKQNNWKNTPKKQEHT